MGHNHKENRTLLVEGRVRINNQTVSAISWLSKGD